MIGFLMTLAFVFIALRKNRIYWENKCNMVPLHKRVNNGNDNRVSESDVYAIKLNETEQLLNSSIHMDKLEKLEKINKSNIFESLEMANQLLNVYDIGEFNIFGGGLMNDW